ncbi:MAG: hypothetical protein IJ900_04515 [Paludibacteraceae bacterium]|nr:hypothetical protein [Paludibacteraceae bacterium]
MKNEVNRALVAKKTKYIVLGLLMSMTLSVNARMYTAGEQVYLNSDQSDSEEGDQKFNWKNDNAKLFLYFFQSTNASNNEWMTMNPTEPGSNVFVGTMSGSNPWYDRVIVVRKDPSGTAGNWDNKWNQSCNINIPDNGDCSCNFINIYCGETANWKGFAPKASTLPSASSIESGGVAMEKISICPNDLNGPFSLRVKLNDAKTQYVYSDVKGHGWYMSYDGITWTEVLSGATGIALDGIDDQIDLNKNQLPATLPNGEIYYYLHSCIPSGRRLIQIKTNSTSCDLDCEITSFETAVSNVNADDNTYTLDGMVAFGKASGDLVISCDGVSMTITDPKSPQAFSLYSVPAATEDGKKTTATAYFTGDQSNCSKQITIDVPNAREAVEVVNVDSLTGKTFVLTPKDYDPANTYVWLANGDTIEGAPQVLVIDPYSKDSTTTYTYKEYYPASGSMDDIIKNGDYEDATGYGTYKHKSTISDNNFWGIYNNSASQMNFYDTCSLAESEKSNGFAVVRSAYHFYPTYAKVEAKSGTNFALFDAATGEEGANKKAWYATTATSSKLKLQKGTTYVLSFWAANVNNYGEMDNAARFKFRIEYNSKVWESRELNLADPEFRNNIWHQCSQTFFADEDCNNVTISVVNLNNNVLNVGNDFALDDIQFHPISTVSKVVKSQQQFVVTAHEPKVDAFTATVVPLDCDAEPNYTVKMHVEYQNPKGQLIIKDVTTNTEYPCAVSAPFDTPTTLDTNIVITGLIPAIHTWDAYFEDWTTAQISGVTTDAPVVSTIDTLNISFSDPGCTELTTTLTFDLDYTYQRGTMTYWVDALPKQTATYTIDDPTKQTLTGLTVANIPADGKNNHVLHVSFDGTNSCVKDYALPTVPFSPVISSVTVSVPATVQCKDNDYPVSVSLVTPYDATGRNIVLSGSKDTTIVATGTSTTVAFKLTDIGAAVSHTVIAAYEATPTCTTSSTPFTPPTRVSCEKLDTTICEGQTVTWKGTVYSGTVGQTDTIVVGLDSLILTVYAVPAITIQPMDMFCDNEANILIPFKTTAGNPDVFDVVINDVHYAGTAVGSDISFPRGAELVAGDYTATVTVGESGSDCSSQATVNFTLAAGDLMYSKWTDVLFISNADGRFVSYQWYKNGSLMYGETQQRLYYSKGLRGTYQCVMTTKDGKTIYTCPQDFEDVQPSRSAGPEPNKVQTEMYDAMGRAIKGQPSKGIYVVIEEIDGERTAKKIIVSE